MPMRNPFDIGATTTALVAAFSRGAARGGSGVNAEGVKSMLRRSTSGAAHLSALLPTPRRKRRHSLLGFGSRRRRRQRRHRMLRLARNAGTVISAGTLALDLASNLQDLREPSPARSNGAAPPTRSNRTPSGKAATARKAPAGSPRARASRDTGQGRRPAERRQSTSRASANKAP